MANTTKKPTGKQECQWWALFDGDTLQSVVCTDPEKTPTESGDNPGGRLYELKVDRAPNGHEDWDPQSKSWKVNPERQARMKKEADRAQHSTTYERQQYLYWVIRDLFPDLEITEAQMQKHFPLVDVTEETSNGGSSTL